MNAQVDEESSHMRKQHAELRDELVAILGAGRELTPDTDRQLADSFIRFLDSQRDDAGDRSHESPKDHQPHYSLTLTGAAWGATLMFLLLLLLLSDLSPFLFLIAAVSLLSLVAAATRGFLFMARTGWRLPRVKVIVAPAGGKTLSDH